MKPWLVVGICAAALVWVEPVPADEWKDEGGKRYELQSQYNGADRNHDRHAASDDVQDIPYGHLPPPGECRDWYPDWPAGHQPPPYRC